MVTCREEAAVPTLSEDSLGKRQRDIAPRVLVLKGQVREDAEATFPERSRDGGRVVNGHAQGGWGGGGGGGSSRGTRVLVRVRVNAGCHVHEHACDQEKAAQPGENGRQRPHGVRSRSR